MIFFGQSHAKLDLLGPLPNSKKFCRSLMRGMLIGELTAKYFSSMCQKKSFIRTCGMQTVSRSAVSAPLCCTNVNLSLNTTQMVPVLWSYGILSMMRTMVLTFKHSGDAGRQMVLVPLPESCPSSAQPYVSAVGKTG